MNAISQAPAFTHEASDLSYLRADFPIFDRQRVVCDAPAAALASVCGLRSGPPASRSSGGAAQVGALATALSRRSRGTHSFRKARQSHPARDGQKRAIVAVPLLQTACETGALMADAREQPHRKVNAD